MDLKDKTPSHLWQRLLVVLAGFCGIAVLNGVLLFWYISHPGEKHEVPLFVKVLISAAATILIAAAIVLSITRYYRSRGTVKVFIVSARFNRVVDPLRCLLGRMGYHVIRWAEGAEADEIHNWDIFRRHVGDASIVVVVLTPDDEAELRSELSAHYHGEQPGKHWQPRLNVVLELGYLLGKQSRVGKMVRFQYNEGGGSGLVRIPSDLWGVHWEDLGEPGTTLEVIQNKLCRTDLPKIPTRLEKDPDLRGALGKSFVEWANLRRGGDKGG